MKNLIQTKNPEKGRGSRRFNREVRGIVQEAWESVTEEQFRRFIENVPSGCQAVIDTKGGPIGY